MSDTSGAGDTTPTTSTPASTTTPTTTQPGDSAGPPPTAADPFAGIEVPEKFKKEGKVNVAEFVRAYKEVEQKQFTRREDITREIRASIENERAEAAPKAPGDYKPPEPWKIGERDFKIDAKDPMFTYFAGLAHDVRMPQDKFTEAIKGYVQATIAMLPDWTAEARQLGGNADQRHARVDGFLKANLSRENYNWFATQPATAAGIKAVEELMTLSGHPPIVGDSDAIGADTYTLAELKAMQRDPRYTGEKGQVDQAFVQKVRSGFQRLSRTSH